MEFEKLWYKASDEDKLELAERFVSQTTGTIGMYGFDPSWPVSGEQDFRFPEGSYNCGEVFSFVSEGNYRCLDAFGECADCGWWSDDLWHRGEGGMHDCCGDCEAQEPDDGWDD